MQLPGAAHRTGQGHAGHGCRETGVDIGVAGANQRRLGIDDLDVAGHPCLEPLARFIQFRLGEPQPLGGDRLLLGGGAEVEPRGVDIGGDLSPQVGRAHARFLHDRLLFRLASFAPEPVQNRHGHLERDEARRDQVGGREAVPAVVRREVEARQALRRDRARRPRRGQPAGLFRVQVGAA